MFFFSKKEKHKTELISVLPKNYRSIALYAIENIGSPRVLMDKKMVTDYSDKGDLTQRGIRKCINFEIRDGDEVVLSFHDHPNDMFVSKKYEELAVHCENEGWLKIEKVGSFKPSD